MGRKSMDLLLIFGFIGVLLNACSAGQLGEKRSTMDASAPPVQKLLTPDNASQVVLLRTLSIPGYQRGNLSQCSLDFNLDGIMLVGACGLNAVPVWDVSSGVVRYSLYQDKPIQTTSCAFSPDGKRIACGGFDKFITLWDASTGKKLGELGPQKSPVWELAFSPDGQRITSTNFSDEVSSWDARTNEMIWISTGIKGVLSIGYDPSGKTIAYGTRLGQRAGVLDAATGEVVARLADPKNNVGDIEYRSDGEQLAAGCDDDKVYLWDSKDYQLIGTLAGHAGYVNGVSFNPDGMLLATGSHDGMVGLWEVTGQKQLVLMPGHEEAVLRVAFNPDGTLLASISWDGTIRIWGIPE